MKKQIANEARNNPHKSQMNLETVLTSKPEKKYVTNETKKQRHSMQLQMNTSKVCKLTWENPYLERFCKPGPVHIINCPRGRGAYAPERAFCVLDLTGFISEAHRGLQIYCKMQLKHLVVMQQGPLLLSVSSAKSFTSFAAGQTETKLSSSGHVAENISTCRSVLTWLRMSLARHGEKAIRQAKNRHLEASSLGQMA